MKVYGIGESGPESPWPSSVPQPVMPGGGISFPPSGFVMKVDWYHNPPPACALPKLEPCHTRTRRVTVCPGTVPGISANWLAVAKNCELASVRNLEETIGVALIGASLRKSPTVTPPGRSPAPLLEFQVSQIG